MTTKNVAELRKKAFPVLANAGFSRREIADVFGLAHVNHYPVGAEKNTRNIDREDAMQAAYRRGETLEQIGAQHGITRERVRQILKKLGVRKNEGGSALSSVVRAANASRSRDERAMAKYGCTHAQYQMLRAMQRVAASTYSGPIGAFRSQRQSASDRNIPFRLSLWQWWTIWQESGHWDERGRGLSGYCMARIGDQGGYEVGNVKIISNVENISESYEHNPADKRRGIERDEFGLTRLQRRVYDLAIHGKRVKESAEPLQPNS
jgi:DNA-binding CsgD family transcriptional regulator